MMRILIMDNNIIKVICFKVIQNEVEFFIGKINMTNLDAIISVTNRIITNFDESGMPIYNDKIQRKPNQTRVKAIKDYLLNDEVANFPNNIIIALPSQIIKDDINELNEINDLFEIFIDKSKVNKIETDNPIYAQIIDGQHRFKGMQTAIEELRDKNNEDKLNDLLNFEFVVSIFIDPGIDFQAMIFSTINRTPVKVSQDLVYDLFGLLNSDSPQKTALAVTLELNAMKKISNKEEGLFYKRIRLLGKKSKNEDSYLSQGIFVRTIVSFICNTIRNSEVERFNNREDFQFNGTNRTIFRKYYAENKDILITKVLINYFSAVRDVFIDENGESYWDLNTDYNVFRRTVGFLALIDILVELHPIGIIEKRLDKEFFKKHLSKASNIKLIDEDKKSLYPFSSVGKNMLRDELKKLIFGN